MVKSKKKKNGHTRLFALVLISWIDPLLLPKSASTAEELLSSVTISTFIIGSSRTVSADFNN